MIEIGEFLSETILNGQNMRKVNNYYLFSVEMKDYRAFDIFINGLTNNSLFNLMKIPSKS